MRSMALLVGIAALWSATAAAAEPRVCRVRHSVGGGQLNLDRYLLPGGVRDEAHYAVPSQRSLAGSSIEIEWIDDGVAEPVLGLLFTDGHRPATRALHYRWRLVAAGDEILVTTEPGERKRTRGSIGGPEIDRRFAGSATMRVEITRTGADPAKDRAVASAEVDLDAVRHAIQARRSLAPTLDRIAADPVRNCADQFDFAKTFSFNCGESWNLSGARFVIERNELWWAMDLGDHVAIAYHAQLDFAARFTWDMRAAPEDAGLFSPRFSVDFAADISDFNGPGSNGHEAGAVQIGGEVHRDWLSVNSVLPVSGADWLRVRRGAGDLIIVAYDTERGDLVRKVVPRELIERAEAELRAGVRRFRARELAPDGQCTLDEQQEKPEEPIVVT